MRNVNCLTVFGGKKRKRVVPVVVLVGGCMLSSLSFAQSALIIYDEINPHTQSLASALQGAGVHVEFSDTSETHYDGTNPAPDEFGAVIHLNGTTWDTEMPMAGQQALNSYVFDGGGIITMAWSEYEIDARYRMSAMRELVLFDRVGGVEPAQRTMRTEVDQSNHPILVNVPPSFDAVIGGNVGPVHVFSTNPAVVLMKEGDNDAVAVREYGTGRVVGFHNSGNYSRATTLSDPNIQQLMINSVLFVQGLDESASVSAMSISDASVDESDTTGAADFSLALSAPSLIDVTVVYHTEDGTAVAGEDYLGEDNGSLTIPAGETSATLSVPVYGDTLFEADETFLVIIDNVDGATLADDDDQAEGTIINDDAPPTVTISLSRDQIYEDPDRRRTSSVITASLSEVAGIDIPIEFVLSGDAEFGVDYSLPSLVVPAGELSASVELTAIEDGINEPVESAVLSYDGTDYSVAIVSKRTRSGRSR